MLSKQYMGSAAQRPGTARGSFPDERHLLLSSSVVSKFATSLMVRGGWGFAVQYLEQLNKQLHLTGDLS